MDFLIILVAHWVGDFLLQTRKMAINKHNSFKWLGLHVAVYFIIILIIGQIIFSWQVALGYAVFNGLLHIGTDFITSKFAAKYHNKPSVFYPILGFDQLLHTACLYWTYINADILAL